MGKLMPADSQMVYAVLLIVCMLAAFLLMGIGGKSSGKKNSSRNKSSKNPSLNFLVMLILAFSAALLFFFSVYLYYYAPLKGEMLVARVAFQKGGGSNGDFNLMLTPYENDQPLEARSFTVKGTAWSLQGEVLNWKPVLGKVGLRTMFRLTAINGHYGAGESGKKGSASLLSGNAGQGVWNVVQGINGVIKLAQVAQFRSEKAAPLWSGGYDVYANKQGFRIERTRSAASPLKGKGEGEAQSTERRYPRRSDDVRH
jgi:hypothetical protein